MSTSHFHSSAEAKKAGWFSRRHETDGAHRDEQLRRQLRRNAKRERELDALEKSRALRLEMASR